MERTTSRTAGPVADPTPDGSLLIVRRLTVRYGAAITALDGVDLEVAGHGLTAVLGGNGAGKTTLLRAVCGTLHHHDGRLLSGDVSLAGRPLGRMPADARTRAGLVQVPEGRRVFGRLTVAQNLTIGGLSNPDGRAGRRDALARVLDLFPVLADRRSARATLLSGGEQQMLAIGRALMSGPRLLILDEPTLGLAPRLIDTVCTLLADLRDQGVPMLLVEQNASVALELASHAFVLTQGRVALAGTADELREDPRVRRLYLAGLDRAAPATPDGGTP